MLAPVPDQLAKHPVVQKPLMKPFRALREEECREKKERRGRKKRKKRSDEPQADGNNAEAEEYESLGALQHLLLRARVIENYICERLHSNIEPAVVQIKIGCVVSCGVLRVLACRHPAKEEIE